MSTSANKMSTEDIFNKLVEYYNSKNFDQYFEKSKAPLTLNNEKFSFGKNNDGYFLLDSNGDKIELEAKVLEQVKSVVINSQVVTLLTKFTKNRAQQKDFDNLKKFIPDLPEESLEEFRKTLDNREVAQINNNIISEKKSVVKLINEEKGKNAGGRASQSNMSEEERDGMLSDLVESVTKNQKPLEDSQIYLDDTGQKYLEISTGSKNKIDFTFNTYDDDFQPQSKAINLSGNNLKLVSDYITKIKAFEEISEVRDLISNTENGEIGFDKEATEAYYKKLVESNPKFPPTINEFKQLYEGNQKFDDLEKEYLDAKNELADLLERQKEKKPKAPKAQKTQTSKDDDKGDGGKPNNNFSLDEIVESQTQLIKNQNFTKLDVNLEGKMGYEKLGFKKEKNGIKFEFKKSGEKKYQKFTSQDPEALMHKISKDNAFDELKDIANLPDDKYKEARTKNPKLPENIKDLESLISDPSFEKARNQNKNEIAQSASVSSFKEKKSLSLGAKAAIGAAGITLLAGQTVLSVLHGNAPDILAAVSSVVNMYINYTQTQQINQSKTDQAQMKAQLEMMQKMQKESPKGVEKALEILQTATDKDGNALPGVEEFAGKMQGAKNQKPKGRAKSGDGATAGQDLNSKDKDKNVARGGV